MNALKTKKIGKIKRDLNQSDLEFNNSTNNDDPEFFDNTITLTPRQAKHQYVSQYPIDPSTEYSNKDFFQKLESK